MGGGRAPWFVAGILLLIGALMGFHLMTIWVSVQVCKSYADSALNPLVILTGAERVAEKCAFLEVDLSEAVDKYLAVFLSLIGGAAASGGYATIVTTTGKKDDEP